MAVKPIPDGYYTVTPYLVAKNAARALDFYKKAFNATELYRMDAPGGKIAHAEFQIGNSRIMIGDEMLEMGAKSAQTLGGSPVGICLYVEDTDALFKQAISAGAKAVRPVKDEFYGDRTGTVRDPFGFQWTISTHVEDVSPEEMARRMAAMPPPAPKKKAAKKTAAKKSTAKKATAKKPAAKKATAKKAAPKKAAKKPAKKKK